MDEVPILPLEESFSKKKTTLSDWKLHGAAKLTANEDGDGKGWLRLVSATPTYQAGTALLDKSFPSDHGIAVEFDLAAYGGTSFGGSVGDGISFYLIDGSTTTDVGGPGGALGYACYAKKSKDKKPGVTKGYVGIGLDQWGSFSDENHAGSTGSKKGRQPNHVVLRGSGGYSDGYDGYVYRTAAPLPTLSLTRSKPTRVHLTIENKMVTVGVHLDTGLEKLIEYDLAKDNDQVSLPPTLKLGLSGSTGMATNIYEISNLKITLPAEMPLLMEGPTSANAGQQIMYTITVKNGGPNSVLDAVIHGQIPSQLEPSSVKLASKELSGGATAGQGSTTNYVLDQPLNLPKGGKAVIQLTGTIKKGVTGDIRCTAEIKTLKRVNTAKQYRGEVVTKVTVPSVTVPLVMDGPQSHDFGTEITYRITVENQGPDNVPDAVVSGNIPGELSAVRLEHTLFNGATAGKGSTENQVLNQPLNLPKGGKAIIFLTGTIRDRFTGDMTCTAKIETPNYVNIAKNTSGSVKTVVVEPKVLVKIVKVTGFEQSWPEEYKGYVCSYNFELAANKDRVQLWQLSFDGLAQGSKLNPQYKPWVIVKKDGSEGAVVVESPEGHHVEPGKTLTLTLQILESHKIDCPKNLRNLRVIQKTATP